MAGTFDGFFGGSPLNVWSRSRSGPKPRCVREQMADFAHAILAVPPEAGYETGRPGSSRRRRPSSTSIITARCRGDDLRQRGRIEDRVGRQTFDRRHERPIPDRLLVQNPIAAPDEDDGARELLVRDRFLDERLDCVEPPNVDGHLAFGWPGRG